jgi:hypothetical protein
MVHALYSIRVSAKGERNDPIDGRRQGNYKRNKKKISRSQLRWTHTIYLDLEISLYAMYIRIKPIGDVCPH